ncbi:hypothetical protein FB451DRAFT_1568250 [Mycena latifolia]|nr:hypothetical protein FB451DRAFT_1568250 [Mycena latifolia]
MSFASLKFLYGFVVGVLSTVACFVGPEALKLGSALLAAYITTHVDVNTFLLLYCILNISVLNVALLLPRLRASASSLFATVKSPVSYACQDAGRHARPDPDPAQVQAQAKFDQNMDIVGCEQPAQLRSEARIAAWVTILSVFRNQLLRQAAASSPAALAAIASRPDATAVDDTVEENARVRPRTYDQNRSTFTLKDLVSLVLGSCVGLFVIFWRAFFFSFGVFWSYTRAFLCTPAHSKTSSGERSTASDDADTTLVDEGGPQSPRKDSDIANLPPSFIALASQSAPASSLGGRSDLRHSASCQLRADVPPFIPLSAAGDVGPKPLSATRVPNITRKPVLDPSVPAFVPSSRPTAIAAARKLPSAADTAKKGWQPIKPLSFAWARGGYTTHITAPPRLNVAAPAFVPQVKTPAAPVVPQVAAAFRSAPPAFWAPGGCAIHISSN